MPRASGSLLSHRQHLVVVTTTDSSTTLVVLDLVGIFVFAIAGGLVAVRKGLDVFGVLVLAGTTGLGGGFLRDVLIGAAPPAALEDWRYLVVPVVAGLLAFLYHPALGRMERSINVLDAFGLGLFCVTGALKAMDYGLGPVAVRADGHGDRHRRRDDPRRPRRPRPGGLPGRALRHTRRWPAPSWWSSAPTSTCRSWSSPSPAPGCASAGGWSPSGATGRRRSRPARRACRSVVVSRLGAGAPHTSITVSDQSPRTRRR